MIPMWKISSTIFFHYKLYILGLPKLVYQIPAFIHPEIGPCPPTTTVPPNPSGSLSGCSQSKVEANYQQEISFGCREESVSSHHNLLQNVQKKNGPLHGIFRIKFQIC